MRDASECKTLLGHGRSDCRATADALERRLNTSFRHSPNVFPPPPSAATACPETRLRQPRRRRPPSPSAGTGPLSSRLSPGWPRARRGSRPSSHRRHHFRRRRSRDCQQTAQKQPDHPLNTASSPHHRPARLRPTTPSSCASRDVGLRNRTNPRRASPLAYRRFVVAARISQRTRLPRRDGCNCVSPSSPAMNTGWQLQALPPCAMLHGTT